MDGRKCGNRTLRGRQAEGPFRYVATVMKTSMFPDPATMSAPHNPRLEYVDGKYVLLYICQNPSKEGTKQRVGMMVADNLEGLWRFAGDRGGIMVEASDAPGHWTYQAAIGLTTLLSEDRR